MSDRLQALGLKLGFGLLGGLSAIPAFVFVSDSGSRFSLSISNWGECWAGLPSFQGIPVPLMLPIVFALILAAFIQPKQASSSSQQSSRFLLCVYLLLAVAMIVTAGGARGIQLLVPLAVLASFPLAFQRTSSLPFVLGWCLGAGLFFGFHLIGIWLDIGNPLLMSKGTFVNGAQGPWGVDQLCSFWGACIYQAGITVPDLAVLFATVCAVCFLNAIFLDTHRPLIALIWGGGWLIGAISAFNSGRSAVLAMFLLQLAFAFWLFIKARSLHWVIPVVTLLSLVLLSLGEYLPVMVQRFWGKFDTHPVYGSPVILDRPEIWADVSESIAKNPEQLVLGSQVDVPGTHSLFGDILLRIGLPMTLIYFAILIILAVKTWRHMSSFISPMAQGGIFLLIAVPIVQNTFNASLLQPFSFINTVMAALAMALLV